MKRERQVIRMRKKAWAIFGYVCWFCAALFLFVCITAPVANDNAARKTAKALERLPLPSDTKWVETVYKAGKLVGNGNGMQYFGAILIKSELSLEELEEHYSKFEGKECVVEVQRGSDVRVIEHGKLTFRTSVEGDGYYVVYAWGDHVSFFNEFDIRGH